jgi:tetratricopeptide (TPR) repeat protein
MGVVYKARQVSLNRLVALKMIRSGVLASGGELARFRTEAEAVARLRHPNIVGIYEIGEVDGRPFFSLEYAEGGSLSARLADTALTPPQAARLVEALAGAMQAAHSAGVVHRDLKPGNILLTADGTPKITDFGLAKLLGGDSGRTESGAILGTPSYMAPEQARGQSRDAAVGPAADVWALGALLYETLTGRPPFRGPSVLETLDQVRLQEPVPPTRLQPRTPRDLEVITLKCLEKDPARRYASAGELAEDLRRFLAGEPIRARPTPRWERLWKWARRRPAAAALVVVIALAALSLLGLNFWYVGRLRAAVGLADERRQDALRGRAEAETQRVRAEGYYDKALAVVDRLLTRVGQQRLAKVPGFEEERRKLLEDALEFYKGFLQEKDNPDSRVRRETARAYHRTAGLRALLGRLDEAEADYRASLALQRPLCAEFPDSTAEVGELASTLNDLGVLNFQRRRVQQAQEAFDEVLPLWERLAREHPDDPENRKKIAQTCHNLCILHRVADRPQQAAEFSRRALDTQEALVRDYPKVPDYQYVLGGIWQSRANTDYFAGRLNEAAKGYRQAVTVLEPVVKDHPEMVEARSLLAGTLDNLSVVLRRTNRLKEAEAVTDRGRQLFEGLARDYPKVPQFRHDLAMCWDNLAGYRADAGRTAEAQAAFARAIELWEGLLAEQPRQALYRHHLARCCNNLGRLERSTDRPAQAEEHYRKAVALGQALAREFPKAAEFQNTLAHSHLGLGVVYARTARRAVAETQLRQALAVAEPLAAANPKADDYPSLIAQAHHFLGEVHLGAGRLEAAEAEVRLALGRQEPLARAHPEAADYVVDLGGVLASLGFVQARAGKAKEALAWYAKALPVLEGVGGANPHHRGARKALAGVHTAWARALRQLGRNDEALQEWDKALPLAEVKDHDEYQADRARTLIHLGRAEDALRQAAELAAKPSLDGAALCRLAGVYALAAAAKNESDAAGAHAAKALELLQKARQAGYFADAARVEELKEDKDLTSLHARPEFRSLTGEPAKEWKTGAGLKRGPS